jgi:hypothetical protein
MSLFILQKGGGSDVLQKQCTFCLSCHLVLYQFAPELEKKHKKSKNAILKIFAIKKIIKL